MICSWILLPLTDLLVGYLLSLVGWAWGPSIFCWFLLLLMGDLLFLVLVVPMLRSIASVEPLVVVPLAVCGINMMCCSIEQLTLCLLICCFTRAAVLVCCAWWCWVVAISTHSCFFWAIGLLAYCCFWVSVVDASLLGVPKLDICYAHLKLLLQYFLLCTWHPCCSVVDCCLVPSISCRFLGLD